MLGLCFQTGTVGARLSNESRKSLMKFVDEAYIEIAAGDGGNGAGPAANMQQQFHRLLILP